MGQVNFLGSLPCSASNILVPMLHPVIDYIIITISSNITFVSTVCFPSSNFNIGKDVAIIY